MGEKVSVIFSELGRSFLENYLGADQFGKDLDFFENPDLSSDFLTPVPNCFQSTPFPPYLEIIQKTNSFWGFSSSIQFCSNSDWLSETGKGIFSALTQLTTGFVTGFFDYQPPVLGTFYGLEYLYEGTTQFFKRGIYEDNSSIAYHLTLLLSTAALMAIGLRSRCGNKKAPQNREFCLESYRFRPAYAVARSRERSPINQPLILMSNGRKSSWLNGDRTNGNHSNEISPSQPLTKRQLKKRAGLPSFREIIDEYEALVQEALGEVSTIVGAVKKNTRQLQYDFRQAEGHHNRYALVKREGIQRARKDLKQIKGDLILLEGKLKELNQSLKTWFNEWFRDTYDDADQTIRQRANALLQDRLEQFQGVKQRLAEVTREQLTDQKIVTDLKQRILSFLARTKED